MTNDGDEKLYSVCFDDDRASAIYSTHFINLAGAGKRFRLSSNLKSYPQIIHSARAFEASEFQAQIHFVWLEH